MAAVELPGLRRVAYGVVLAQAVLTALLAALCYFKWGPRTGLSAALGGGIGTAASLALAVIVFRKEARELAELVRAFYAGEAAKFGVTIVLFVVVLVTMKRTLVPGALFGAFVAVFLVHWVVLPRAMRRLDRGQFGG
ncbi:MAG TPA: ATP synthase subunit I [Steroidobacteraceae bacterium]|nr:ATP synthase subunit I [Steroidobacteraceae bacterium]